MRRRKFLRSFALAGSGLFLPRRGLAQLGPQPPIPFGGYGIPYLKGGAGAGNGLLTNLVSYWIMNEASNSTRVDRLGISNLSDVAGTIPIINGTPMSALGGSGAGFGAQAAGSGLRTASGVPYSVGLGNSFTMSGWMYASATFNSEYLCIDSGLADGNYAFGLLDPNVGAGPTTVYFNDNGTTVNDNITLTNGSWHYYTVGYDASSKLAFISIDAGTRTTAALTSGVKASTAKLTFGNTANVGESNSNTSGYQDWGFWARALSTSDVSKLYASGAGFPFSSFTT